MGQDITNRVNSQFAAAGRSGSPVNTQALARGIAQGEAPVLTNEYNNLVAQQQGAANAVQQAGQSAGMTEAQLNQLPLTNQIAAMNQAAMVPGLWTAPGASQLNIANMWGQLPWENLMPEYNMLTGLSGLGGQSQGQSVGYQTQTQQQNPWTTAAGLGLGLMSLIPKMSLSDERLKEDIEPVGILFNRLPIYKYRFRGSPRAEIGVMAQDVEQVKPEAVADVGLWHGGPTVKMVDYDRATAWAA
jgi:hypothetical protein